MNTNIFLISALIFSLLTNSPISVVAQINTPCSPAMLSSASGCMSFLTGGGTSPTSDCCRALKSLTGTGMDCLCLIVTASVPINLPINRTLAISLPRACGMPGVPVQCKASAAPLPAPDPSASFGPTTSPTNSQTSDSEGPTSFGPTTSPTTTSLNPNDQDYSGWDNKGDPAGLTPPPPPPPSASLPSSSHSFMLSLLLFAFAFEIIKFF